MLPPIVKTILYRLLLPIGLLTGAIIRPCFMSIGYILLALLGPLLPTVNSTTAVPGSVRLYVWGGLLYSVLTSIAMVAYQIYEAIRQTEDGYRIDCETTRLKLYRSIGFIRFHGGDGLMSSVSFLPEVIAIFSTFLTAVLVAILKHRDEELDHVGSVQVVRNTSTSSRIPAGSALEHVQRSVSVALKRFTNFAIIVATAVVGCVQPSILSAPYFLTFLFVASWWSTYKPLRHGPYNAIKKFLIFWSFVHVLSLYAFQIPIIQNAIGTDTFIVRLFGLSPVFGTKCENFWGFYLNNIPWPIAINPLCVLILYFGLALQLKWTVHGTRSYIDDEDTASSVHEELLGSGNDEEQPPIALRKVTSRVVDQQKISHIFTGAAEDSSMAAKGMATIVAFGLYHAYTLALATMMVWALLYHSIIGLILLVLTCVLWICKDSRKASFRLSPAIVAFIEMLLVAQYVCSLNITAAELGMTSIWWEVVGITLAANVVNAFITLSVKLLLSLPVFLLLRLNLREKYYDSLSAHERLRRLTYGTFQEGHSSQSASGENNRVAAGKSEKAAAAVQWITLQTTKAWIVVVSLVLLAVSLQNHPVVYTIGFFCLWALFVLNLKVSFRFFVSVAYLYWLTLIVYTSVVIISLYIYQFQSFPEWWQKWTHIDKSWNDDIGLINYSNRGEQGAIFVRLLAPLSLFVVTMLQLKFFHEPWSDLVRPVPYNPAVAENAASTSARDDATATAKLLRFANELYEVIWRILEVHFTKLVILLIAIVVANDICAIFVPLVLLLSLAICLPNALSGVMSIVMCAYLCLVSVVKMTYQLSHFPDYNNGTNSGEAECNATQSYAKWLGLEKNSNTWTLLWALIGSIVALALQSVIQYRQRYTRITTGESEHTKGKVFPSFSMEAFDESLVNGIKFMIDYLFFRFGLEICLITMAINAWVRMDLLGAIMCVWLAFLAISRRPTTRSIWPLFVLYMTILFPLQYVVYVGLPEEACLPYPWSSLFSGVVKSLSFDIWFTLPNYDADWPAGNLIVDLVVLLLASCQLSVFRREGNVNDSIYDGDDYYLMAENPRYDFIATKRSFVDYVKHFIFHFGHWITLMATLAAGIGGTSLFALGYIMITLWILWQGTNLYVMNAHSNSFRAALKRWYILLTYTVITMFCKVLLQLAGCVFLQFFEDHHLCIVRQFFSVTCVNTAISRNIGTEQLYPTQTAFEATCPVDAKEAQIGFDAIALGFLVFQIRIFGTWYFQHCMVEYRSEVLLANRGAILKNQLIEKEMKEQNGQQQSKFDEIRVRTLAIRERYNKQLEKGGTIFEPQTYGQAKRAGDYYMFDYDPSTDELVQPVESFVPEVHPGATDFDKLDPGQLVYTAASKDLDMVKTMKQVEQAEKIKDSEGRMIAAVRDEAASPTSETVQDDAEDQAVSQPANEESTVASVLRFIRKIVVNAMDMTSSYLNRMSREYRYVSYVLQKEKAKLKDSHSESLVNTTRRLTEIRQDMDLNQLHIVSSESDIEKLEMEARNDWQQRSAIARLVRALCYCVAANTDMLCYVLAFVAHAGCAGLITLPLPLMVLFWGTLSNPRPSKFFWVAMITYTEFVIVVKFICQFPIFTFNNPSTSSFHDLNPLALPKVLGVQRQEHFAVFDIALLFALFFHRTMLRKLGLWKDATLTETFVEMKPDRTGSVVSFNEEQSTSQAIVATSPNGHGVDEQPTELSSSADVDQQNMNPVLRFIHQLFHPKFRYIRDLYPVMFALDVVAFLMVSFGYSSFGEGGSGSVIGDIQKSRIPLPLVVMLITMTLMIVIDRGLYLRKWVYGKLAYQLVIVIFLHVWIFFLLPEITKRAASENRVAQILYVTKCIYLLVSAWQIRNGYPQLCIGNLLTHAYGLANMVFFKIFMAVPFLFELRTAIDWTWTDTSMPLFDFFNMENFYAVIYNLKCARTFEANYPAPRGVAKGVIVKYFMGLPMILLIVLLVWSPLLAFSLLNQIGDITLPNRVHLSMSLEGFPPLYEMDALGPELRQISQTEYADLNTMLSGRYIPGDPDSIRRSRTAVSYLDDYKYEDIMVVDFRPESSVVWQISNDSMAALQNQLKNSSLKFIVSIQFSRPYNPSSKTIVQHSASWDIKLNSSHDDIRQGFINILNGNTTAVLDIPSMLPSYMWIPNEGEVTVPEPIVESILYNYKKGDEVKDTKAWFDTVHLQLEQNTANRVWVARTTHPLKYDNVSTPSEKTPYPITVPNTPYGAQRPYLQTVAFVDRAFPSFFAKYLQGGVIAVYISLVIVAGRLIRSLFANNPMDVMITEIPNPDYLLKICLDIYLVREAKDFILEQDLFAKLIFLFRSPATLIQWTRYKVKQD